MKEKTDRTFELILEYKDLVKCEHYPRVRNGCLACEDGLVLSGLIEYIIENQDDGEECKGCGADTTQDHPYNCPKRA